jgi:hypothetical protein
MKNRQSFLNRMRFLNKKIFNLVTLKFAGSSHSPISIIRHVGRRSGTRYATPVVMVPFGDKFIFALPYGTEVDWYRNVQAAGRGTVVWHGKEYLVEDPEPLVVRTGLPGLPLAIRLILPIVGAQLFRQMKSTRVIAESHPEHQKGMAFE